MPVVMRFGDVRIEKDLHEGFSFDLFLMVESIGCLSVLDS